MPNTNPKNKSYPKVCAICKQPFIGYAHQKFCSQECYRKSYSKKHCPSEVREATCLWCHKKITYTQTRKFCDVDCRTEFNRAKEAIERKYPFEHEECNKQYERLKVQGKNYVLEAFD